MLLDLRPWRNCFNNCIHRPNYTFACVLFHLTELSVFAARKFNALTIRITAMAGLSAAQGPDVSTYKSSSITTWLTNSPWLINTMIDLMRHAFSRLKFGWKFIPCCFLIYPCLLLMKKKHVTVFKISKICYI